MQFNAFAAAVQRSDTLRQTLSAKHAPLPFLRDLFVNRTGLSVRIIRIHLCTRPSTDGFIAVQFLFHIYSALPLFIYLYSLFHL